MQIKRHFVPEGTDPFSMFEYEQYHAKLQHHKTNKILFDMHVEVPKGWSNNAKDIVASKYFRRAGVPHHLIKVDDERHQDIPVWIRPSIQDIGMNNDIGGETSIKQVVGRIVGHWTYVGYLGGYFDPSDDQKKEIELKMESRKSWDLQLKRCKEANAQAFYDENVFIMLNQMAAPNSPQWFNTGLWWAYGITGKSQGHWKVSIDQKEIKEEIYRAAGGSPPLEKWNAFLENYVARTPDPYSNVQVSACFILGISDHLNAEEADDGIAQWYKREAVIFKYGSGSGLNVSPLRAADEPLGGGGKSSGMMSWLKVSDYNAGAIKSGGTTRRAACMRVCDLDHPDILDFITCKSDSEAAVAAMVTGSKHITTHCQGLMDAIHALPLPADADPYKVPEIAKLVAAAIEDEVPDNAIDKAIQLARFGETQWFGKEYGTGYEDEAYTIAPFQNANHSVSIRDEFYEAVREGKPWQTTWRTNGKVAWERPAREVEHQIAKGTWISGDPGVQFWTTINQWNVTPNDGPIDASNPCCLVGDTLVDTSEGRIKISDLALDAASGKMLPHAFAFDIENDRPVLRRITNAWCSGQTYELIEVKTDKGLTIRCTPEHPFLLRSGRYVEAKDLRIGQSLRKVGRSHNPERGGRRTLTHKSFDTKNQQVYQSRWMYEQANGPIPEGQEVHHKNEDPTDDRLSNFTLKEKFDHRSGHAKGSSNPRYLPCSPEELVDVWDRVKESKGRVTPTLWNKYRVDNDLVGKIPAVTFRKGVVIRGIKWAEFEKWIAEQRDLVNDKVHSVTKVTLDKPIRVYDISVDGVHNFAISNESDTSRHTIVVHNSEHLRLKDSACNLASLNLLKFLVPGVGRAKPRFDGKAFTHVAYLWQMILDISVEMCHLPSRAIAINVFNYRDTGLGYANLGATLMSMGLPYDSDAGRAAAGLMTGLLHGSSLLCGAEMARNLGPYPRFWANKEHHLRCVDNHRSLFTQRLCRGLNIQPPPLDHHSVQEAFDSDNGNELYKLGSEQFEQALVIGAKHGFRNAESTVLAPTGTISLVMDCETTGGEPMLGLVVYKILAGGGQMLIEPASCVQRGLESLGYSAAEVTHILGRMRGKQDAEAQQILREEVRFEHHSVFDTALSKVGSISVKGHIKMMAAQQAFISGAISKTVNIPSTATIEDIKQAYRMAHGLGVKCVAIFRDKSKLSQPLNLEAAIKKVDIKKDVRPMTPEEIGQLLSANRQSPHIDPRSRMKLDYKRKTGVNICVQIGLGNLYLMTSHYPDGKLGEIWATYTADQGLIQALLSNLCKTANVALQYGVPLEAIIRTWQDSVFEPRGVVYNHPYIKSASSMLSLIAKLLDYEVLGNTGLLQVQPEDVKPIRVDGTSTVIGEVNPPPTEIVSGQLTGKTCPSCGGQFVVPSGANCEKCKQCGYAGGCG